MFSTIFTSLATVSQRSGHLLDKAAASAAVEVARSAGSQAADRERARFEALMHDGILSTLLVAAEDSPSMRMAVAAQARATLARLEALSEASVDDEPLDPPDFVRVIRAAVTATDPAAQFDAEILSHYPVPGHVAATMSEAMTEALRNSLKHAAAPLREVNRAVHVRVVDAFVDIAIIDDGRGFDPATVQAGRMGLAVSIRGRMEHLDSGSAAVSSAVGRGTAVTLTLGSLVREDVLWGFPERPDVSKLLRIDSAAARAVVGLFLVVEAIIGLSTLSGVGHPLPTIVGLLLVTSATVLGSLPGDHPMSVRGSAAVVTAGGGDGGAGHLAAAARSAARL